MTTFKMFYAKKNDIAEEINKYFEENPTHKYRRLDILRVDDDSIIAMLGCDYKEKIPCKVNSDDEQWVIAYIGNGTKSLQMLNLAAKAQIGRTFTIADLDSIVKTYKKNTTWYLQNKN